MHYNALVVAFAQKRAEGVRATEAGPPPAVGNMSAGSMLQGARAVSAAVPLGVGVIKPAFGFKTTTRDTVAKRFGVNFIASLTDAMGHRG